MCSIRASVPGVFISAQERAALQVQQLILGDDVDRVGRSAGQHAGEFGGYDQVMVGRESAPMKTFRREIKGQFAGRAGQLEFDGLRRRVIFCHAQGAGLGIREQAVAIHGNAVALAQEQQFLRIRRRLRHSRRADGLEHLGGRGHRPARQLSAAHPAREHFLASSPARQQTDAALH